MPWDTVTVNPEAGTSDCTLVLLSRRGTPRKGCGREQPQEGRSQRPASRRGRGRKAIIDFTDLGQRSWQRPLPLTGVL